MSYFAAGDGRWRRYGGVLTDLFYDHFLSIHWQRFASQPRLDFIEECYRDLDSELPLLPKGAHDVIARMQQENWLATYATVEGMEVRLGCVAARLRRPTPLEEAISILKDYFAQFEADFLEFYPELIAYTRAFAQS
jgi:acyl carrier protein phosphodiesterase